MINIQLMQHRESGKKSIIVSYKDKKYTIEEYYELVKKYKTCYENSIVEINNQLYYKNEDLKKLESIKSINLKNIDYHHKLMREMSEILTDGYIKENNKNPESIAEIVRESLEIEISYNKLLNDMENYNCEIKSLQQEIKILKISLDKKTNNLENVKRIYGQVREFQKECHDKFIDIPYEESDDIFAIEYMDDND